MLCLAGCGEEPGAPQDSAGGAAGQTASGGAGAVGGVSTGGAAGSAGTYDAGGTPSGGAAAGELDRAFHWLSGRFDSNDQAEAEPSYFAIQLETCPVTAPDLGQRVLYVEQARMDSLKQPYRQRLYVVEDDAAGSGVVSRVFELKEPARWVGACAAEEPSSATGDDVEERSGCAVHLESDGDRFVGGTVGTACASTLNGASYATSEVTLDASSLESWDRGFAASGDQVWGATAGPYVFVRRTELPGGKN